MAFTKEIEQFEFEFDQEWADMVVSDTEEVNAGKFFDIKVHDGSTGPAWLALSIEQAREVRSIIDAQIEKYEAWEAARGEA